MKVIISGGGTGGHLFPALAIADEIKRHQPDADILFVGALGRMEMERVPKAGYEIIGLPIAGFQRTNLLKNWSFPFKLFNSMWKAYRLVKTFQPDIAIGVGGYASGPTLRAAGFLSVPTIIQEQNSYAGVTNKLLAKKAKAICVAYNGMERFFPAEKLVLTGNPVRQDLCGKLPDANLSKQKLGLLPDKKTILIMGGSLGAATINKAMDQNTVFIENQQDVQFYWQCGKGYYEQYKNSTTAQLPNVHLVPFIEDMPTAYSVADVMIARAGALTISEICVTQKPTILVPSPHVAEDHQTKNAESLASVQAAILVKDNEAPTKMLEESISLLHNHEKMLLFKENLQKLAKPDAIQKIYGVILKNL